MRLAGTMFLIFTAPMALALAAGAKSPVKKAPPTPQRLQPAAPTREDASTLIPASESSATSTAGEGRQDKRSASKEPAAPATSSQLGESESVDGPEVTDSAPAGGRPYVARAGEWRDQLPLYLGLLLVAIVALLLVAYVWLSRSLNKRAEAIAHRLTDIEKDRARVAKDSLNTRALLDASAARQETIENGLRKVMRKVDQILREGIPKILPDALHPIADEYEPASDEIRFPIAVGDYVKRLQATTTTSIRVETDAIDHMLFTRAGDGSFLLFDNPSGATVVPFHERFTKQLFTTYYDGTYDCESPGSGEVWLARPATADRKGDHWRLSGRGRLEVRPS